jgi:hypothetical protein
MMLMNPIERANVGRAADYFGKGDGGYYLDGFLRREWGGKLAPMLESVPNRVLNVGLPGWPGIVFEPKSWQRNPFR